MSVAFSCSTHLITSLLKKGVTFSFSNIHKLCAYKISFCTIPGDESSSFNVSIYQYVVYAQLLSQPHPYLKIVTFVPQLFWHLCWSLYCFKITNCGSMSKSISSFNTLVDT